MSEMKELEEQDGPKYIPLEECEHGRIYKLNSRNLAYGVFNKKSQGFTGLRTKFDDIFLFEEDHWDTGVPYGTVKPLEATNFVITDLEDRPSLKILLFEIEYKDLKKKIWELTRENYSLKKHP